MTNDISDATVSNGTQNKEKEGKQVRRKSSKDYDHRQPKCLQHTIITTMNQRNMDVARQCSVNEERI